jgi:hypothetical protein
MTNGEPASLPVPTHAGGHLAITETRVVGTSRRELAEVFVLGEEAVDDGEIRVTVLGSSNPWVTRPKPSGSLLIKIGNRAFFVLVTNRRRRGGITRLTPFRGRSVRWTPL